ncbi:tight junction protein ZO-1 isoform X1 [Diachasma alloeum]|uniref:tight junction protein ZO-1 isoform X1 n=2 Tax=Diachasma alloeum TaxID=454923 RepID=UPI0007383C08|nr:tight junction protein ZO-1 isoform X1 [Diachasma alloeum]
MAGSSEVKTLLSRHKASLLRELNTTDLLSVLVKRCVITEIDKDAVAGNADRSAVADIDLFIDVIGAKGFDAFREFCFALEAECPHVLTDLLVDQHSLTGEHQQQDCEEEEAKREQKLREQEAEDEEDIKVVNTMETPTPRELDEPSGADINGSGESDDCIKECPEVVEPRRWSNYPESQRNGSISPDPSGTPPPPPANYRPANALPNGVIPTTEPILEVLDEPVDEPVGDRGWEVHHVTVTRVPGYGFGIAVSGGRDNPHFTNGDPAIAISDVLKAGPAEGKLQVNDRIISANGVSLEGADYGAAVRVLRDSGSTVLLVVKRRALGNSPGSPASTPQSHRLTLTRNNKKDDFGIVLGCRLYVREVTREGTGAKPGDIVTRIGGVAADNMSLKEARKMMDQCKDRLSIVVTRDTPTSTGYPPGKGEGGEYLSGASYSSQNLYVPPPTRQPIEDKSNLAPRGRSRGPLMDVSLSQLDLPATPTVDPPRPPPPRLEDYYSSRRQIYDEDPLVQRSKQPMPDPRFITFQKEGSVGVRLTGGNETGVFVTAVQPGSPASLQGLQPGDKILKVNDMDMKGVTREEAVLFLLSLQEQIDLIVQHRRQDYEQIVASGRGDSFHIKTHFHYEQPEKGEMSFRSGDVFHVVDTLHNGVVGSWQVFRIGRNNQEVQKGIIPNKARAEELATAQFNATKKELSASESRGSFFRRRRGSHRRSKSLGRDHWDDVVFSDSVSKFPAYERVVLRHPGFIRPVVLFGPVADLAREKLLKDFPDKFTSPQMESQMEDGGKSTKTSGIIRLSAIREVMDRGKHALLDITPNAVDRLNYAQFYPIVIFLKAETKQVVKEMRAGIPKSAHKSSKKLLEQCQKLDKIWGHVFSAVITLTTPEAWYRKLRELIDRQQQGPLWMSQTKPEEALSDDFLFPMTSRLSYASSPESDLELSPAPPIPGALGPPARLKSSSDPSIATQDDTTAPPPYTSSYQAFEQHKRAQGAPTDSKYGFSMSSPMNEQPGLPQYPVQPQTRSPPQGPPDLPPRVDRNVKPTSQTPRGTIGRSAADRLLNKTDSVLDMGNYINATPHRANATSSLERTQPKTGSYDSMSSYDSYNNTNGNATYTATGINTSSGRLGPNVPDDLKTGSMPGTQRAHDPYRFTRSTAQPINSQDSQTRTDYAKYSRTGEHNKVIPTTPGKPSGGTYKPVPPPKPKNYRPPQQPIVQDESNGGSMYQHAKSYSMNASHLHNGTENGGNMQRNSGQYYYNIPPPNRNDGNYLMNSNHTHNHTPPNHSHSLSHTHPHSNPPITAHSHSNSVGQLTLGHTHNRNTANVNGHSHSNSHVGTVHPSGGNSGHNREASGLDLAGSREQRGSAFELYRKPPLHHHNVRSTGVARGLFDSEGGVLEGPGGVSLTIPPGALAPNTRQEIYFAVTTPHAIESHNNDHRRTSISPPMHQGESLLSPVVECGPRGLEFKVPVDLRIPHNATPAHKLALKAIDVDATSSSDWLDVKLPEPTSDHILVKLDHF